jgi:hypothetical protein
MATVQLYQMLYLLGMDPNGGTIDRNFNLGMGKYATFADMPPELAAKLGLILRDMENVIVRETLQEHSRDWYVDKITQLARAGAMNEKEFYELIGRKLPGPDRRSVGSVNEYFRSLFEKSLVKPTKAEKMAAMDKTGNTNMTPAERSQRAMQTFKNILGNRMGTASNAVAPKLGIRSCEVLFTAI